MRNLQDYLTVGEAAHLVGVSPRTLRAWDRAGKLKAARNPMNRYRLYRREDLERFLTRLSRSATLPSAKRCATKTEQAEMPARVPRKREAHSRRRNSRQTL